MKQTMYLLSFHEEDVKSPRWREQLVQRSWGRSISGMFGWLWRHFIKYGMQRNMMC